MMQFYWMFYDSNYYIAIDHLIYVMKKKKKKYVAIKISEIHFNAYKKISFKNPLNIKQVCIPPEWNAVQFEN